MKYAIHLEKDTGGPWRVLPGITTVPDNAKNLFQRDNFPPCTVHIQLVYGTRTEAERALREEKVAESYQGKSPKELLEITERAKDRLREYHIYRTALPWLRPNTMLWYRRGKMSIPPRTAARVVCATERLIAAMKDIENTLPRLAHY